MNPEPAIAKFVFFAAIDAVTSFPAVMGAIRTAVKDPRATAESIARAVERDVAFSGRLLRIVNAPEVGLMRPCASVAHAASLVGMARIASLAEATASRAALDQCIAIAPELATRSATRAVIARALATVVSRVSPEQAFTSALLCDVGTVAILAVQPSYREEQDLAVERARFGFVHPELGGDILRRWNMPNIIADVVSHHHDLAAATECSNEVARMVALLQVADMLGPRLEAMDAPIAEDVEVLAKHPAFALLELDADKISAAWPTLRNALDRESGVTPSEQKERVRRRSMRVQAVKSSYRALWISAAVLIPGAVAAFMLFR